MRSIIHILLILVIGVSAPALVVPIVGHDCNDDSMSMSQEHTSASAEHNTLRCSTNTDCPSSVFHCASGAFLAVIFSTEVLPVHTVMQQRYPSIHPSLNSGYMVLNTPPPIAV
ncbi:hypothetical protein [Reinekea sp. G2M2-21]|uniref:hypothetical protein n=1 Tax=Reinekea sp. G2M2-21 TaxID=2788942 RepID=UPI0018AC356C|nr:hypothetical protein [Reinekea sp. G2M2-21]